MLLELQILYFVTRITPWNLLPPCFRPLTGLYEPSAIVQLEDGRFPIAEDEKDHPVQPGDLRRDGGVERSYLSPGLFDF